MWQKALENAKLIISTFLVMVTLVTGTWTLVTNTFYTKAEAREYLSPTTIDVAYNKAFRIESAIRDLRLIEQKRELSETEKKSLKRLLRDLKYTDDKIYELEKGVK